MAYAMESLGLVATKSAGPMSVHVSLTAAGSKGVVAKEVGQQARREIRQGLREKTLPDHVHDFSYIIHHAASECRCGALTIAGAVIPSHLRTP